LVLGFWLRRFEQLKNNFMATTPEQHFDQAKKIEAFIMQLVNKKGLKQTLKIGLWPNPLQYDRNVNLLSEINLDDDLQDELAVFIKEIFSAQITRCISRQHAAAAMITASEKEAQAEKSKNDFNQKTIFDISKSAQQYLDNYPELKK
jgi:hypothetical protein